jgi:H+/Cl- antiporter ClcA
MGRQIVSCETLEASMTVLLLLHLELTLSLLNDIRLLTLTSHIHMCKESWLPLFLTMVCLLLLPQV